MDQQVYRNHLLLVKEYRGALANHSFLIEWIQPDGTQNWLAKVKYTGSKDAALSERIQMMTDVVGIVAAAVWKEQYGQEPSVSNFQTIECCNDYPGIEEFFVLFECLSATRKFYRGDATLLTRDGRLLARWEGIRGERLIQYVQEQGKKVQE